MIDAWLFVLHCLVLYGVVDLGLLGACYIGVLLCASRTCFDSSCTCLYGLVVSVVGLLGCLVFCCCWLVCLRLGCFAFTFGY